MKVFEIFKSISGEVGGCPQGSLATFIRFSGCNLRCKFCDAEETQSGKKGLEISINQILNHVKNYKLKNIIITGGEPSLQSDLPALVKLLVKNGFNITIETNGTFHFFGLYLCTIVMDYKLDNEEMMNSEAFRGLIKTDFIKFVIKDATLLEKAIEIQKTLKTKAQFAYSPMMPKMTDIMKDPNHIIKTQNLVKMITDELMKNKLQGIINIQMHKILNLA